ncbi:MAG: hypothetical protein RL318_2691 [Fibrobacterota bacterium]
MRRTVNMLALVTGLLASGTFAGGLTLAQAISEGVGQGPEAQVLKNSVDSANEKVRAVKSVAYPHLNGYVNAGLGQSPNASAALMKALAPMLGMPAPSEDPYYSYSLGVQVTQPIYTFGKVTTALHMASTQEKLTVSQTSASRLGIQSQVVEAWFNAYLAHARLDLLAKSIDRQSETVKNLQRTFEMGSGLKAQLLMARSKLIASRQDLISARSMAIVTRKALNRLLARPSEDTTVLDTAGIVAFEAAGVPDRESLLRTAYQGRQDLQSMTQARSLMEDYAYINKAAYYPTIAMQGKFGFTTASQNASAAKNTLDWENRDWLIGIGMQWNIFDGWDNAGQAGQTRAAVRTMDVRLSDMKRNIEISGENALSEKIVADSGLASALEGVAAAREAFDLYQKNFNGGSGQLTDILSAEEALRGAELGVLSARLARVKSHIQISLVQGKDLIPLVEAP